LDLELKIKISGEFEPVAFEEINFSEIYAYSL
jgi:hypothetical protein